MLKHLLLFYKWGGKQLYYFNTYDGQGEIDINSAPESKSQDVIETNTISVDDSQCDSCVI
jgi:hypothetical protein